MQVILSTGCLDLEDSTDYTCDEAEEEAILTSCCSKLVETIKVELEPDLTSDTDPIIELQSVIKSRRGRYRCRRSYPPHRQHTSRRLQQIPQPTEKDSKVDTVGWSLSRVLIFQAMKDLGAIGSGCAVPARSIAKRIRQNSKEVSYQCLQGKLPGYTGVLHCVEGQVGNSYYLTRSGASLDYMAELARYLRRKRLLCRARNK